MAAQEHNVSTMDTYADRLEREYPEKQYEWLIEMLRKDYSGDRGSGNCSLYLADQEDHQAKFDVSSPSELDPGITERVTNPLSDQATRFVVVAYGPLSNLNFALIDRLAKLLELQPDFLSLHFGHARWASRDPGFLDDAISATVPALLPSATQHLHFLFPNSPIGQMTVTQSKPSHCDHSVGKYPCFCRLKKHSFNPPLKLLFSTKRRHCIACTGAEKDLLCSIHC